ncbi:MAG: rod shape-determining protein MreC [Treponema sp.]|nr:rod shape-determining protein MreC [Treponema sp.]
MKVRNISSLKFRLPEFLLVIFMLISGVFLACTSGSFIINFKKIGFSILSVAQKGVYIVVSSVQNTVGAVRELTALKRDYDELAKKLENYEQMRRTNAEIRKENEQLKEQLGFIETVEQESFPANIISRDIDKPHALLTIDRGSVNGINKNMPVIAYQNGDIGLVGKIVEVGKFTSTVMPIYNIDCIISARIQNTRDIGLVSGLGGNNQILSMKYIKKRVLDELHYGDVIVTSGENGNYMRNMPIGTISEIRTIDYDSSLDITIAPIIDFSRLETVIVVDQKSKAVEE